MVLKKISGKIISGRSRAPEDIMPFENEINNVLGGTVYPGTLNLVLNTPILLNLDAGYSFNNGKRYLWKVTGSSSTPPIYICRWLGCPMHVIELISTVKIRDIYNLQDGENFSLDIDNSIVKAIPIHRKIAWYALWKYRSAWYYQKNSYKLKVYKFNRIRKLASQN